MVKCKSVIVKILENKKSLFCLFIIYFVALSALIRANFGYVDDLARVARGYRGWDDFGRYISNGLSPLLHGGFYLTDISPLTQLLAAFIMALAGICLLQVFSDGKSYSWWSIIAVLPMGLSPYFLECFSYKFDAPYMALAVLVSIVPILFRECGILVYMIISILGVLAMCMSYQAASGIYPMVVMFLTYKAWNSGTLKEKEIKFLGVSFISYFIACLLFYIFIYNPSGGYVEGSILSLELLVTGVLANLKAYYSNLYHDFKKEWIILIFSMMASFWFLMIRRSAQKKWVASVCGAVVIGCGCVLSFGMYLLLANPIFAPRAMFGFGVFISLIAINIMNVEKVYVPKVICVLLSWSFFVFSFTYGNALAEQARYTDFRVQMVINDLGDLEVMNTDTEKLVQLSGDIGKSPIIDNMSKDFPILNRLVPSTFGSLGGWTEVYFFEYFGLRNVNQYSSWSSDGTDLTELKLPILCETQYHIIRGDDKNILIELK